MKVLMWDEEEVQLGCPRRMVGFRRALHVLFGILRAINAVM